MIFGIGTDIIKVSRIRDLIEKQGNKFLSKIFSDTEVAIATDKSENHYHYFAKRFAAKEAFAKAFKTGIGESCKFKDIEILNNENGAPYINVLIPNFNYNVHLSLADEIDHAIAFVILEK